MLGLTPFKDLPRPMQAILLINVAIYLLTWVGAGSYYIVGYGAFVPQFAHELWRYLSYAFVHTNFMHILFNMLMFWMFATDVCKTIGEKNFTALYLVSAVFAAVFSLPFYVFNVLGNFTVIIGASGALFGVMAAYAYLFPERTILMFFVIPMKIKHAIWVFIALDLFMSNSGDGIAHYTHLGGVLSGYLFMLAWSRSISLKSFFAKQQPKKQETFSKEFFREQGQRYKPEQSGRPLEGELHKGHSNAKEERLNEILEKINRSGLQSLNQEERNYLQWFGQQNRRS